MPCLGWMSWSFVASLGEDGEPDVTASSWDGPNNDFGKSHVRLDSGYVVGILSADEEVEPC